MLMDSLLRGFPVGTLLLWRRPAQEERLVFGDVHIQAPAAFDALWVVDGQQRIVSLVSCLLRSPGEGADRSPYRLFLNLDREDCVTEAAMGASHLPFWRMHSAVAVSQWARDFAVGDAVHTRAQDLAERLLRYEIPAYITSAEREDDLREVFARANNAGKRMRWEEIHDALNVRRGGDAGGPRQRIQAQVMASGFGEVEIETLLRALLVASGHSPTDRGAEDWQRPGMAERWEEAVGRGLKLALEFLRDEAQIPHRDLLPYELPLVFLPTYFERFPRPSERALELLVRWVWRGAACGGHASTDEILRPHFRLLQAGSSAEEVAVSWLGLLAGRQREALPHAVFNLRGHQTRLLLALLHGLGPRRLGAGAEPLGLQELLGEEPGQASAGDSAARFLRLCSAPAWRRHPANFLLHPVLSPLEVPAAWKSADDATLESHLIPASARTLLKEGRMAELVQLRQERMVQVLGPRLESLAQWGADDDGPSLSSAAR
jgi:hypothetical protein